MSHRFGRVKNVLPALACFLASIAAPANAAPDCTALQSAPVYQVINPKTKANLLTASESEATNAVKYGFTDNRGILFYAAKSAASELVGAHRMYNATSNNFFWAINPSEIDSAVKKYGYVDNGVNFFVAAFPANCTQPVYRLYSGDMFRYATSKADLDALTAAGWKNDGIKFYGGVKVTVPPEKLPTMGINLGGPKDWSSEWFFADAMKQGRPFASVAEPWTGLEKPIAADADGWPTGDAGVLILAVNSQHPDVKPHPSGTYRLFFKGQATPGMKVKANGTLLAVTYDAATQSYTANVQYDNKNNLFFTFEGITGGVKDVRLIRPGDNTSDTFDNLFLQRLKAGNNMFGIVRFMETTATNGSKIAEWSQRTPKSYATQQRKFNGRDAGMSWEYVIELSNQTGKDPWINIPHLASDDYIRNLATLFKNNLNSDRKIYVEYSNEIWNEMASSNFAQRWEVSKIACDKVLLSGDPDNYFWGLTGNKAECRNQTAGNRGLEYAFLGRHSAWRLKRIGDIFREVFGEAAMITRIRPILAWDIWTFNKTTQGTPADQLNYLNQRYGAPSKYIYGIAVGAYVSMQSKTGDASSNPFDLPLSVNQIFERMTEYNQNFLPGRFASQRGLADQYGLKMFAYEGGPGLFGDKNFNNMLAAQTDPRMKNVVKTLLQSWKDAGGDTFVYYNLVSSYANHGFWGLSERLEDENTPKWQAVKEKAAEFSPALSASTEPTGAVEDAADGGGFTTASRDAWKNAFVFVFANKAGTDTWWLFNPNMGWRQWAGCSSTAFPYMTGLSPSMVDLSVFSGSDFADFKGSSVFVGYGQGGDSSSACNDMLENARYMTITVQ